MGHAVYINSKNCVTETSLMTPEMGFRGSEDGILFGQSNILIYCQGLKNGLFIKNNLHLIGEIAVAII